MERISWLFIVAIALFLLVGCGGDNKRLVCNSFTSEWVSEVWRTDTSFSMLPADGVVRTFYHPKRGDFCSIERRRDNV